LGDTHPHINHRINLNRHGIGNIPKERNTIAQHINFSFLICLVGIDAGIIIGIEKFTVKITLALFLSVWICDTGAFFFGKKFGKKKILPDVSPKKTWVGTIAGFICSVIFLLILNQFGYFPELFTLIDVLALGIIAGLFGQFGDWAESLLKREAGVKDTSNILAGHGGILDRFDSLTFAAPLTLIYCTYFIKAG